MPFFSLHSIPGLSLILMVLLLVLLCAALYLYGKTKEIKRLAEKRKKTFDEQRLGEYLSTLDEDKLTQLIKSHPPKTPVILVALLATAIKATAQDGSPATRATLFSQPGVIILIILILLPILLAVFLMGVRVTRISQQYRRARTRSDEQQLEKYLGSLEPDAAETAL
ncbi:MAG TPA: hypothetical protein VGM89_11430, partial [Puia sp.]